MVGDPLPVRSLRTVELVDLARLLGGWVHGLALGVGLDGTVVAVGAETRVTEGPSDYRMVWWRDGESGSVPVPRLPLAVWFVQPHPDGVLLVDPITRRFGVRENAIVVDRGGREQARFTLGDAIADVRTSADGTIWVSYFDEGALSGGELESAGLRRFTGAGEPGAGYDARRAGTDTIADCYATNLVGDDEIYVYFYTEFPIVRVRTGVYRVWNGAPRGARAIAVRADRALLFGAYRTGSSANLVELGEGEQVTQLGELVVTGPDGEPVDGARALGVGERLYLLAGTRVLVLDGWWED